MRSKTAWRDTLPLAGLLLCLAACDSSDVETRQLYAFGTVVSITVYGISAHDVDAAVSELETSYRVIDANWYPWSRSDSPASGELAIVNEGIANGRAVEVSADLARLIRRATEVERLSDGRFSIATGQLSRLWGFDDLTKPPLARPELAMIEEFSGANASALLLDWTGNKLSSGATSIILDPGGIAKGSILDRSRRILGDRGIHDAIVDLGGDLVVMGRVGSRNARIGIRSPRQPGIIGWLEVSDGESVMTSGDYERYFEIDGTRYQHIIDPRSGLPVSHTVSATVVHRDAELADAAATALVVGGLAEFDEICKALDVDLAMIIDASGDMRLTQGLRKRVNWAN